MGLESSATRDQLPIPNYQSPILLSVIIPAYNEEKLIASAIGSVLRSNSPLVGQGMVEVIVTDNASTDATAEIASKAGARVVTEPKRQIARSRNTGASHARGRHLIFLDADSEMHPGQLQRVADLLSTEKIIGGGAVISMEASWDFQLFVGTWNLTSRIARLAAGSFLFCERAAFERVGGFDESLYASEELALSVRLKRLARQEAKKFVILSDLPVRTSNRKIVDHTRWEVYGNLLRLAVRGKRALRNQTDCHFWYPETRR
jgi:glycosyltransferase involved in cell wall biosynthesis